MTEANPVHAERRGELLLLTISNPPVNAVSHAVAQGLLGALRPAQAGDVRGVLLRGAGKTFVAGADIAALGLPREQMPPLRAVVQALDALPVPSVALLHGHALGGGLELALACAYRLAAPDTRLGFPEVRLGLLPGAGGTLRLPRVVGVEKAAEMMLSGEPVTAGEALDLGLVDALLPEGEAERLAAALAFLQGHLDAPPPRVLARSFVADPAALARARERLAREKPGGGPPSRHAILEMLELGATLTPEQAWEQENARFVAAKDSRESRALRRLFIAERAARRVRGLSGVSGREVRRVGVVGAGTMGSGIAAAFLNAGYPVTLTDRDGAAIQRGRAAVQGILGGAVKRGKATPEAAIERLERLRTAVGTPALADCDLVVEAAFEDMGVKTALMRELGAALAPDAIIASNTSSLDVDALAGAAPHPAQVLGLHFFSPAHLMRLLEVVRGERTAPEVLAAALDVARRLNKVAVVVGVCDGFVGNRMLYAYRAQATALVDAGASPQAVDAAMRDFGMAMGPFEVNDLAGLDIGHAVRVRRAQEAGQPEPDGWVDRVVRAGRLGRKTGAGIYDYPGSQPQPSPVTTQIIDKYRSEHGIQPRSIPPSQIQDRLLAALVNEAAHILEEGVAERATDVDLVYVHGYGFPRLRGGPLGHADAVGLGTVLRQVEAAGLTPAPLLARLAAAGETFLGWQEGRAQAMA